MSRLARYCSGGALAACVAMAPALAAASNIVSAEYAEPTTRYDHGILGDEIEWGALRLHLSDGSARLIRLPEDRVFEDLEPRLFDLDGDGAPEVIAVETGISLGARLSIYGAEGLIAATPHIGSTHRWLSPIGAGDLDGDGKIEIAYIDRPHLAKVLRIWRFDAGQLVHVVDQSGLTNHRIGWDYILGGVRDCGSGPEIITADAGWAQVMASRINTGKITSRALGKYSGAQSITAALECAN